MNARPYHRTMVAITTFMVIGTTYLVVLNAQTPGLCPTYPLLGLPACIVVDVFFVVMLAALLVGSRWSDHGLYGAATLAAATSIYFSARELLGLDSCPRLFDIPVPLCFTVFPTMGLLMWLRYRGRAR